MLPHQHTTIPHVLAPDQERAPITLTPDDTARRAAELMAEKRIGAVLIMAGDRVAGIFTERDLATRVVAPGRDPDATKLAQVMTRDPDTIAPDDTVRGALNLMAGKRYRHLPVVDHGRLVAIISIRDLRRSVIEQLETDILMLAEALLKM